MEEVLLAARCFVLFRERGKLRELLVYQADGGGELIAMDVVREETTNVAFQKMVSDLSYYSDFAAVSD